MNSVYTDSCPDISQSTLLLISKSISSTDPAALIIKTRQNYIYNPGKICIGALVYIPVMLDVNSKNEKMMEEYPPDSLYLDIAGSNFQVVPKTQWSFQQYTIDDCCIFRYYKIYADFRDLDSYKVSGYLECIKFHA